MGVVLFSREYSVVLGDIFNFYNVGMREMMLLASSLWPEMLVNMPQCPGQCAPHRPRPTMKNYLVQNINILLLKIFSVEIFCSNIYQTLSYFNISEFNIIFWNSDLHSLLMCRYQKTLFFPSLLQSRNVPSILHVHTVSFIHFHSTISIVSWFPW